MNRSVVMLGALLLLASVALAASSTQSASSSAASGATAVQASAVASSDSGDSLPPLPTDEGVYMYTINIKPGWNMISFPYLMRVSTGQGSSSPTVKIVENTCGSTQLIHYDPANTAGYEYFELGGQGTGSPFSGYWFRGTSYCKITIEGTQQVQPGYLYSGWNQVGGPSSSVLFNSIKGNCDVTGGPWKYNADLKQYEKATSLNPGEAYYVRVSGTCLLGENNELPPLPTDEIISPQPTIYITPQPTIYPTAYASVYPTGTPIILHRIVRDCATERILTQAESLRIDPNSPQYYGLTMQDPTLNIQRIDLRIYQNGNYGNYECKSRYQEQCIDDGSFDNYYDESCEYANTVSTPVPTVVYPSPVPTVVYPSVTVNQADLTVTDLTLSTTQPMKNMQININLVLKNYGTVAAHMTKMLYSVKYPSGKTYSTEFPYNIYIQPGATDSTSASLGTSLEEGGTSYVTLTAVADNDYNSANNAYTKAITVTSPSCVNNGLGRYSQFNLNCFMKNVDYSIKLIDISAFVPKTALFEVYLSGGGYLGTTSVKEGETATVTSPMQGSRPLLITINKITPGAFASTGYIDVTFANPPTPTVNPPYGQPTSAVSQS